MEPCTMPVRDTALEPFPTFIDLLLPTTPVLDPPASVRREHFGHEWSGHDASGLPYAASEVKGGTPIDE
jgi:hypothetical protein